MEKPIKSLTENEHHETYYEMRCVKIRDEYGDENKICDEEGVLCNIKLNKVLFHSCLVWRMHGY